MEIDPYSDTVALARIAREEYIRAFMADVPAELACLLPVTVDAGYLLVAEQRIREIWESIAKAYKPEAEIPLADADAWPKSVNWDVLSPEELLEMGMRVKPKTKKRLSGAPQTEAEIAAYFKKRDLPYTQAETDAHLKRKREK